MADRDFAILAQPQDFETSRVVAMVPLDINLAVLANALAEGSGILAPGETGNQANRPQPRRLAGVFLKNRAAASGHDDRLAHRREIARTAKVIAPRNPPFLVSPPRLAAPAVPIKADDLFHEVPGPDQLAVGLNCVNDRTDYRNVGTSVGNDRRRQYRPGAVNLLGDRSILRVQHKIRTGRRAEMEKLAHDGGR